MQGVDGLPQGRSLGVIHSFLKPHSSLWISALVIHQSIHPFTYAPTYSVAEELFEYLLNASILS